MRCIDHFSIQSQADGILRKKDAAIAFAATSADQGIFHGIWSNASLKGCPPCESMAGSGKETEQGLTVLLAN